MDDTKDTSSGHCAYYLPKKKRFCRMIPKVGELLCGEHMVYASEVYKDLNNEEAKTQKRKRIPCPLDSKHTVYEDKLSKHLKHCNARHATLSDYYEKEVNSGFVDQPMSKVPLSDIPEVKVLHVINKLYKLMNDQPFSADKSILLHHSLKEEMDTNSDATNAMKHYQQQASIIGNMEKFGLLRSQTYYIEFGAGRGKLSHWVARALSKHGENVEFILIDRANNRRKFDGLLNSENGPKFNRIKMDIENFNLVRYPFKVNWDVVGIGKHLCGAATDVSLRCLMNARAQISNGRSHNAIYGVIIALCCHHRCNWKDYVNREYFLKLGFDEEEFNIICSLSSWATCSFQKGQLKELHSEINDTNVDASVDCGKEESESGTTPLPSCSTAFQSRLDNDFREKREEIGKLCKQLLNMGRVVYMQNHGYDARLIEFIDFDITPENICLIVVPDRYIDE